MSSEPKIKVAVDAIVFGYESNTLNILLIRQKYGILKGSWVLPGGFVKESEPLSEAVSRELKEEAGIEVNYLEQLYTFGDDINRDHRGRIITIAYFALVNPKNYEPRADTDAEAVQWFPLHKLPKLGYDHMTIVNTAWKRLQSKLSYQPIGFDLLNKEFLFSELENLYCTILERDIDRRNFRKKMLSFGIVEATDRIAGGKSGRPAQLFTFNKRKYAQLVRDGIHFEIKFA